MIAALFDVEGTLFTKPMGRGLLSYAGAHGHKLAAYLYYAVVLSAYSLHKIGLRSEESARRSAIGNLSRVIGGWTVAEGEAAFAWVVNTYLMSSARADVMARLEAHRAAGDAIVLVSGMLVPCLERLCAEIGASGVIGTPPEVKDGRYTGRVSAPVMIGREKSDQTLRFVAERGLAIDWPASFAYGDSLHDRWFMELVGHPVAVYPDRELNDLAAARQWQVLGLPKAQRR